MSKSPGSSVASKSPGQAWVSGLAHDVTIPQTFDRELTVVAWSNLKGIKAMDHPGHAALLMRRKREDDMWKVFNGSDLNTFNFWIKQDNQFRYFSFFPYNRDRAAHYTGKQHGRRAMFSTSYFYDMDFELSNAAVTNLRSGKFQLRKGQYYLGNDMSGTEYFGTGANEFVSMPLQDDNGTVHIGFNTHEIAKAANDFKKSDQFAYLFVSTDLNCSGVAARLMHAGGGTAFAAVVGYNPKHYFYVTPNDVVEYGTQAVNGLAKLNVALQGLWQIVGKDALRVMSSTKFQQDNPMEIYTASEWTSRSWVTFKTRGFILREIDKQIGEYHKHSWDTSFPEKLKALCLLIYNVHLHFQVSKSGKRDDAFVMLASQIVRVVRLELLSRALDPWPASSHYGVGQ